MFKYAGNKAEALVKEYGLTKEELTAAYHTTQGNRQKLAFFAGLISTAIGAGTSVGFFAALTIFYGLASPWAIRYDLSEGNYEKDRLHRDLAVVNKAVRNRKTAELVPAPAG